MVPLTRGGSSLREDEVDKEFAVGYCVWDYTGHSTGISQLNNIEET